MQQPSEPISEREIFVAALRIHDHQERASYIDQACQTDQVLRRRVNELLKKNSGRSRKLLNLATDDSVTSADGDNTAVESSPMTPDASTAAGIDISQRPFVGRYQLLEQIGCGGMGTVYMAQQSEPVRRRVAVKVINPGMNSREVLARFEAERQALALMDHPYIAQVFDGGSTEAGLPYFVMELVRGVPISDFCLSEQLSLPQILSLFVRVCEAVEHAHQKGVIHRDLKPNNILVTVHDERAVPKVIDFGVAKALNHDLTDQTVLTLFSAVIGTPIYMSPEQACASGLDADTRSDVYSLGVVLYELLTGTPPFDRETLNKVGLEEFRNIVAKQEPDRPSSRLSTIRNSVDSRPSRASNLRAQRLSQAIPMELDWIVLKTLEKDRERRYGSARELADDVRRYLNGGTVLACPPTLGYRASKFLIRHRVPVGVTLCVFLALCFLVLMSFWQVREVNRAWQASQLRERQATNLLEVVQLQTGVGAFRQADYSSIPELLRPIGSASESILEGDGQGFFHQFLVGSAIPSPTQQTNVRDEIVDCDWNDDQRCLWTADVQGNIYRVRERAWRAERSKEPLKPIGSIDQIANAIATSPDGKTVVVGTKDGNLSFWSTAAGFAEQRRIAIGSSSVETVTWSPDGNFLVAGTRYESFWVGTANGEKLFQVTNDHRHESFLFRQNSQSGKKLELYVATRSGMDVYEVPSGKKQRTFSMDEYNNSRALCWAGTSQELLVACNTALQSMVILDAHSGRRLGVVPLKSRYPQSLTAMNNGRWIAGIFPDGLVQIVKLGSGRNGQVNGESLTSFHADSPEPSDEKPRFRVISSAGQVELITSATNGIIRRWNFDNLMPINTILPPSALETAYPVAPDEIDLFFKKGFKYDDQHCDRAYPRKLGGPSNRSVGEQIDHPVKCFSSDISLQGWIACAGPQHVTIYDLRQRKIIRTLETTVDFVGAVAISPRGDSVAIHSGGEGGVIAWYSDDQWRTASCRLQIESIADGVLCFSDRNGQSRLIWDDCSLRLNELSMKDQTRRLVLEQTDQKYRSATISNQGDLLAIGGVNSIRIVDILSGEIRFQVGEQTAAHCLRFLPGDRVLLSGHESGHVRAWHLPTNQAIGVLLEPQPQYGIPSFLIPFPGQARILVNYSRSGFRTPFIVGGRKSYIPATKPEILSSETL